MKRIFNFIVLLTILAGLYATAADPEKDKELFSSDAKDIVYFVPQFSDFKEISMQEMLYLKKVIKKAERDNVKAVIMELDTPGGRIDVAMKYISILSKSSVPVISYVNPKGISAGMIISLGCDRIAIAPDGLIGDAMPIQVGPGGVKPVVENPPDDVLKKEAEKEDEKEKTETTEDPDDEAIEEFQKNIQKFLNNKGEELHDWEKDLVNQKFLTVFFKDLQVLAEKNDRPVRVVRAMADPFQRLTLEEDGIEHQKNSPLTLSAKEAHKLNVVDYICYSQKDLLKQLGLQNCEVVEMKKNSVEQIVAFLSYPAIAGLFLTLGIVGIYIEVRTPGFGIPGAFGVTFLTLYFLGHIASGASSWGPMVIFFVGLLLIALEVFVIPGFGITGVLGICCMVISMFAAFGVENFATALNVISISLLSTIIIIVLLTIYVLPNTTLFKKITLSTEQNSDEGYSAYHQEDDSLIGKIGVIYNPLRPSGTVVVDGKKYEAASDGDYLEKGEKVEVVELKGFQIVVKKV